MPGTSTGASNGVRPAAPSDSAALLEGVVLSPRHGYAYVMRPGGGLVAVNLASGKVQWRSDKGAKPLALVGDRLIAQADNKNALELVSIDARSGASRESVRIPLPSGVKASVVDTAAGSFRVQAQGTNTELMVRWESTAIGPAQGYMPAPEEGQPSAIIEQSVVMVGETVLDLPSMKVKAEPAVRAAQAGSIVRSSMEELSSPALAGVEGRQLLSADGRHVLVTEPVQSESFTLHRHRWTIFERSSGTKLGTVPAMVSASPFVVVGNTLYHTVPAHAVQRDGKFVENPVALRAVNLKGGIESWKMAVLDSSFTGPFPP